MSRWRSLLYIWGLMYCLIFTFTFLFTLPVAILYFSYYNEQDLISTTSCETAGLDVTLFPLTLPPFAGGLYNQTKDLRHFLHLQHSQECKLSGRLCASAGDLIASRQPSKSETSTCY